MHELRPLPGQPAKPEKKPKEEPALNGTFISVLLIGAFIAVTWGGVFFLFVSRN